MKTVELAVAGLVITWDGIHRDTATIMSSLKEHGAPDAWNSACDAIESLVLGHWCAGVDVSTPEYIAGITTAVCALENNVHDQEDPSDTTEVYYQWLKRVETPEGVRYPYISSEDGGDELSAFTFETPEDAAESIIDGVFDYWPADAENFALVKVVKTLAINPFSKTKIEESPALSVDKIRSVGWLNNADGSICLVLCQHQDKEIYASIPKAELETAGGTDGLNKNKALAVSLCQRYGFRSSR